ncbi:hypothetical protein ACFSZS_17760 [Seohaeicola zhoushanensis]
MALARALAIEPRMLLLDEPFGALDAKVRKELRQGLREIHDRTGLTTVFVTHDQDEAMEIADLVVFMSKGHIEQMSVMPPPERPAPCRLRRDSAGCRPADLAARWGHILTRPHAAAIDACLARDHARFT